MFYSFFFTIQHNDNPFIYMDASGYYFFYIMLSWTGQKLSHPICTVGILRCTFYFYFPLEIVMLMTSTVCAGCLRLRAEEEIFAALAQVR